MSSVRFNDSPYLGTVSRPAAGLRTARTECLRCGSSLAGRTEGGVSTFGGRLVRIFACPCGRRRRVEVAAR